MIKLMIRIQRQFLHAVGKAVENEQAFLVKLRLLEDPDADNEVREDAEKEVMREVEKFGVWIGAGDLLTVKMIQKAVMLMAGSATAFGRLEFLGPFRLQLLHMKMKKAGSNQGIFRQVLILTCLANIVSTNNKSISIFFIEIPREPKKNVF